MIGWAAASGSLSLEPVLLFLIIFFWTPPHFWALALYRADDYARAGFPTLASRIGVPRTRGRILAWTLALVAITLVAGPATGLGALYAVAAAALGVWFVSRALALVRAGDDGEARRYFLASLAYLFGLFGAMIADLAVSALA
jgi:protoheme IX farnesyltransferase